MFEQDLEDQLVDEVPTMETVIRLTGFMEPDNEKFGSLIAEEGYEAEYERARKAIEESDAQIEGVAVEPFPDDEAIEEHLFDFAEDVKFQNYYADADNVELGLVPIESLIAWQPTVATSGYQDLETWEDDPLTNLQYTLPLEDVSLGMVKEIQSAEQQFVGIQVTSRSPNIRVTQMASQRLDHRDAMAVQFVISADPNWIKVVRYEDRLILKNGYHRVYQLLDNGADKLPAVVVDTDSYSEVSGTMASSFHEHHVLADRPPLVTDFHTDAVTEHEEMAENTTIRILAERIGVPR